MSSLFDTLFNLRSTSEKDPLEDFTTEIFAHCLNLNKEILFDFLKFYKIIDKEFETYTITTQYHLTKINDHHSDSRPDVVIFLDNATIFFENKVGASEGYQQLKRYAEHLDQIDKDNKTLVYLTRDFEEKNSNDILKNCTSPIQFISLRWHQVAHFFRKYRNQNLIVKEFLIFLKTKHLSMNNQFSPVDILTLSNFSNVTKLMDEAMNSEVTDKFKSIDGNISQHSARFTQLKNYNRYIDGHYIPNQVWIGFGFWIKYDDEQVYPDVSVVIESGPKEPKRETLIEKFKIITTDDDKYKGHWVSYNMDSPSEWGGISYSKSLADFLSEEDQVTAIRKFFLEAIGELHEIFNIYIKPVL